jgi:hypothetical protein
MAQPTGPAHEPIDPAYAPPAPPRRRSGVIILVAVAVVGLAAIAVTIALIETSGETTYTIVTPPTAGGIGIDGKPSTLQPSDIGYKNIQDVVGGRAKTTISALYRDPSRGLLTVQAATGDLGKPDDLLNRLRAHPPQAGESVIKLNSSWKRLIETDPGVHGGKAVCGELSISVSSLSLPQAGLTECDWQTAHTYMSLSLIASPGKQLTAEQLADVMRRMRPDLEKPA